MRQFSQLTILQRDVYPCYMDAAFIQTRMTNIKTMIENIDDVMLKLSMNPRASYSLDTGQGSESVTAASLPMLENMLERLWARYERYASILNGTDGPIYTAPSF